MLAIAEIINIDDFHLKSKSFLIKSYQSTKFDKTLSKFTISNFLRRKKFKRILLKLQTILSIKLL